MDPTTAPNRKLHGPFVWVLAALLGLATVIAFDGWRRDHPEFNADSAQQALVDALNSLLNRSPGERGEGRLIKLKREKAVVAKIALPSGKRTQHALGKVFVPPARPVYSDLPIDLREVPLINTWVVIPEEAFPVAPIGGGPVLPITDDLVISPPGAVYPGPPVLGDLPIPTRPDDSVPPVPGPSSWTVMLAGLAAGAVMLRRRRTLAMQRREA